MRQYLGKCPFRKETKQENVLVIRRVSIWSRVKQFFTGSTLSYYHPVQSVLTRETFCDCIGYECAAYSTPNPDDENGPTICKLLK